MKNELARRRRAYRIIARKREAELCRLSVPAAVRAMMKLCAATWLRRNGTAPRVQRSRSTVDR